MAKISKSANAILLFIWKWWGEMSGSISIPLGVLALIFGGKAGAWLAIVGFAALWVYVIKTAFKNHQLVELHQVELTALKNSKDDEIHKTRDELSVKYNDLSAKLEALLKPKLNIEFDSSRTEPSKFHSCKILIFNQSQTQNAEGLNVRLVSFKDEVEVEYPEVLKRHFHPPLPLTLNPVQMTSQSINPGDCLAYGAFSVQMSSKIDGKTQFVANFNSHAEEDLIPAASYWVAGKKYRIKFAASAREMPHIEREFELEFFEEGDKSRMTLTPII